MYESPINMIISKLCTNLESDCLQAVQRYGFDVDKEELARALCYDRKQYEKGHTDGYNKAIVDFVNACKEDILCQTFGLYVNEIERIAEQLREGGKNE